MDCDYVDMMGATDNVDVDADVDVDGDDWFEAMATNPVGMDRVNLSVVQ
jgi:hypothetical protein